MTDYQSDMSFDRKNFYIKEGKAYTEENVLIYKVYVCSLPQKCTHDELSDYFGKFGELKDIKIIPGKKKVHSGFKMAFVQYMDPESASKALGTESHILRSKRIQVKAGASWHQPRENDNGTTILALDDYCLENIMKRLDTRDKIQFARTCPRFQHVFVMNSKLAYKNLQLDLLDYMPTNEIQDFFRWAGESVLKAYGQIPEHRPEHFIENMGAHCVNMKVLDLSFRPITQKFSRCIADKLQMIEVLDVSHCDMVDTCIKHFQNLKQLKSLLLIGNYELTGKHMKDLPTTLEELTLGSCCLRSYHVIAFCKTLKNLKTLEIRQKEFMSTSLVNQIAKYCTNLENFKFTSTIGKYDALATMPKLKSLSIYTDPTFRAINCTLLTVLIQHKAEQLENLHIIGRDCVGIEESRLISRLTNLKKFVCGENDKFNNACLECFAAMKNLQIIELKNCDYITNSGLLKFVMACTTLRCLDIQYCYGIDNDFILELIPKLRKEIKTDKNVKRNVPIVIKTNDGVMKDIQFDKIVTSANDLIKLQFEEEPIHNLYESMALNNLFEISGFHSEGIFDDLWGDHDDDDDDYDDFMFGGDFLDSDDDDFDEY